MDKINDLLFLDKKELFRMELSSQLASMCIRSKLFSEESFDFTPEWKENAVHALIGGSVVVSSGLIAILVATGVFVALPGVTIPIGLAGIGAGLTYNMYKTSQKKKEYGRIVALFHNRDWQEDIAHIVNHLVDLYENTIVFLTSRDTQKVAHAIAKVITRSIKKAKVEDMDELLNPLSLYTLLLSQKKHLPKKAIETSKLDNRKRNIRSTLVKTGLYCGEKDTVFVRKKSRPNKYGVVFFKDPKDLEELVQQGDEESYKTLHHHEAIALINNSIYRAQKGNNGLENILGEDASANQLH